MEEEENEKEKEKYSHFVTLNCAVEEYKILNRAENALAKSNYLNHFIKSGISTNVCRVTHLLPQDRFVNRNITSNDILIVSVGGNDIALHPNLFNIFNLVVLNFLNRGSTLLNSPEKLGDFLIL